MQTMLNAKPDAMKEIPDALINAMLTMPAEQPRLLNEVDMIC